MTGEFVNVYWVRTIKRGLHIVKYYTGPRYLVADECPAVRAVIFRNKRKAERFARMLQRAGFEYCEPSS